MTETDLLAERARVGLLHLLHPMPPGVALDMVMDATGDRGAALTAIRGAFVRSWRKYRPAPNTSRTFRWYVLYAQRRLWDGDLAGAAAALGVVRALARVRYNDENTAERDLGADWLSWCSHAETCLKICRALTEAATPKAGAV